MRPFTIIISILFVAVAASVTRGEQTNLGGEISSRTLSSSGNPYIIDRDLVIPKGTVVTIKPGVVLMFKNYTGMTVQGTLHVLGSPDNPVIFTTVNDTLYGHNTDIVPNPFDWNGIFIPSGSEAINIKNFKLMYSVYGIKSLRSDIILTNGIFRQNGQFHFTINDNIVNVQDNLPFFYPPQKNQQEPRIEPVVIDDPGHDRGGVVIDPTKPDPNPHPQPQLRSMRKLFAFTFLAGAVVFAVPSGYSGFMTLKHTRYLHDLGDAIKLEEDGSESKIQMVAEYENVRKEKYQPMKYLLIGTGSICGLSSILSLYFFSTNPKSVARQTITLAPDFFGDQVVLTYSGEF